MQNTQQRQKTILSILSNRQVNGQQELCDLLEKEGIKVTQGTLSRDLKALGVSKAPGQGYVVPAQSPRTPPGVSIVSVEFSSQVCVVKTQPGFASALAALIDRKGIPGLMGTLAGDDTILLVLREAADKISILEKIRNIL